jgi:pimeloyl-ACP methyl ester carboxylesterase
MTRTGATRSNGRLALILAFLLIVALGATASASALGRTQAHPRTTPQSTTPDHADSALGPALREWLRLHANRASTLRSLTSPVLRRSAFAKQALAAETPCGQTPGLLCSNVVVPLDRTGVVPGTISLHVERLPALGAPKGVMFLIAGGPGQGSARSFQLSNPGLADYFRFLFPGYTLVAYDDRGTGESGLLRCPSLESPYPTALEATFVAACAVSIGPTRDFYSTLDHAADLDAVRAAIGATQVALYGVSYGTKLALAYTEVYPANVQRVLLDSVVQTNQPDPFAANVLYAMPNTLTTFCQTPACQAATHDLAGDEVAVANKLAATPATGKVLLPNGATLAVRVTGDQILSMTVDADLNPGLSALLPSVLHEARLGDMQPLLRLASLDQAGSLENPEDLSEALNAATVCHDGPFPWQPDTAVADRPAIIQSALTALPAGSYGPFGNWAPAIFGTAHFCAQWPSPAGGVTYGNGTVPNVPMLAVSGGFDMRTPTAAATNVAAMFPQGKVLVVPGVGHSVLGADPSFCGARNVRSWMLGTAIPSQCPRAAPFLDVVPSFPPVRSTKPRPLNPTQTLDTASKTIHEAEGIWLMNFGLTGGAGSVAGVYSGRLVATSSNVFKLVRYSVAPGVELSGKIRYVKFGPPNLFDGVITVAGAAASHGLLGFSGSKVGGTLGGTIVSK